MYIQRHIKNAIQNRMQSFPVVLLTGPRQVGKSTVLLQELQDLKYVSLDNRIHLNYMMEDPLGFFESQGVPLVLDEIQRAPDSFLDMKYVIDRDRSNGMFILSGSQKYQLMKNISDSLAGRISTLEMLGLSLREIYQDPFELPFFPDSDYLSKRNNGVHLSQQELWSVIHRGGLPELYANDSVQWEDYYAAYLDTYLERDVRDLTQVGDLRTFTQFMTVLAARTGEMLNMHAVGREVGVDDKTVKRWLSILEASGIIYFLEPFYQNATKRVVKTPKIYFTDTGLVCFLCRWISPDVLMNGAQAGGIYESFVVSEILKSYYNAGKRPHMYYFRDTNGKEVDLLFYENGMLHPVEIKKTASPNIKDIKHFKNLEACFPTIQIGQGGIICNYPDVAPLDKKNTIIPIGMV